MLGLAVAVIVFFLFKTLYAVSPTVAAAAARNIKVSIMMCVLVNVSVLLTFEAT